MCCCAAIATRTAAADKVVPPKVPVAQVWTVDLDEEPAAPPVADASRVYLALKSGHLTARDLADPQHELWRIDQKITSPMAVAGGLLFVSTGDAVEAINGADHAIAWTLPKIKTAAPLVAVDDWLIAVTDAEVLAIAAKDGRVIWRKSAGGVSLAPVVDEDRVYVGASDGTILALTLATGEQTWDAFVDGGVTAIAAYRGLVYAGGERLLYCYKNGKREWYFHVGATVIGHIAVDAERVYFTAKDNVVRGHERTHGNERWRHPLSNRPFNGVMISGHLVFVPVTSHDLPMLFDANGKSSGTLSLPDLAVQDLPPDVQETPAGVRMVIATGSLMNKWQLSLYATTGEPALVRVADMLPDVGAFLLTDPELQPVGKVLGALILGDPPLVPVSEMGFPIVLRDPPLEPLTTLPGLQMRPLSPQLPPRREGSQPGG